MASEISKTRQDQNQDLLALQSSYKKRRDEIVESNDKNLQDLKDKYSQKEQDVLHSNEAHINHIRKDHELRSDELNTTYNQKMSVDKDALRKKHENIKIAGKNNIEQLKKTLDETQEQYEERMKGIHQKEDENRAAEHEKTKDYANQEVHNRVRIEKGLNQENQKLLENLKTKRKEFEQDQKDEQKKLTTENDEHIKKLVTEYNKHKQVAEQQGKDQLKNTKDVNQKRLDSERNEYNQNLTTQKNRAHMALQQEKQMTDEKIKNEKVATDTLVKSEKTKGISTTEKLRKEYDTEIKRVHQQADKKIGDEKTKFDHDLTRQNQYYEAEIKHQDDLYRAETEQKQKTHLEHMQQTQVLYDKELVKQNNDFHNIFSATQTSNQEAVNNQQRLLARALEQERVAATKKFGTYQKTENDPFYQHNAFETRVTEDANYFVVKANVPEHEQHNVDIIIKKDSAVVQGSRSFEEQLNKQDRKIATNSFQTFREEIPFGQPVVMKAADKKWENGVLTVKVPKLIGAKTEKKS